jgi:hypothetical protein
LERRRDTLLRGVVDQVQSTLVRSGFQLSQRGMHPEVHWVEYRAAGGADRPTVPQPCVMLAHVLDNHTLGASVRWYHGAAPRAAARTAQAWTYQPGSDRLLNDDLLASTVAAWVQAAVASGPPSEGAGRNGRAFTGP